VERLTKAGVKPALVLDEGGFLSSGLMPGLTGRAAIVGIAEKGYLSLRLTARAEGGHSSMPTGRTAIGALARGIARLEANPFPSSLDGPTRGMVDAMVPYLPFSRRLLIANLWITGPLVARSLAENPLGAALQHTTIAPTMLAGGIKDNVLPPEASAVVNFRIRPGETVASVTERVHQVVADSQIGVAPIDSVGVDPSPVSDIRSPAYRLITETIRGMAPGERLPVIPYLVMGGTDAKFWGSYSDRVFRFLAVPIGNGDRERIHGVNERISFKDYATSVAFFARLLHNMEKL
jgi:carboxypeptidase PM20D1